MAISMGPNSLCFLLISIFLLSSSSIINGTSFEYCNKKDNHPVKVTSIEIHPDHIEGGKPVQFKILATAGDVISKGKVEIDVKYFFVNVHSETKDLCQETTCPVEAGDFVMSHEQTLPWFTPPGSYTLTMKLYGEDGKTELTCIYFDFSIGFLSSVADM